MKVVGSLFARLSLPPRESARSAARARPIPVPCSPPLWPRAKRQAGSVVSVPSHGGGGTSSSSAGHGNAAAPTESNPPGDIPDNQAYVAYQPSGGTFRGFTDKVPEGWARTAQGAVTDFKDKLNSVRISAVSAPSAPTVASVRGKVVAQPNGQVPKFGDAKVTTVSRHAGPVVLLTYKG